jgi:hypothetical protein
MFFSPKVILLEWPPLWKFLFDLPLWGGYPRKYSGKIGAVSLFQSHHGVILNPRRMAQS